jgi:hypothetical protein
VTVTDRAGEGARVVDYLDVSLQDDELLAEIELATSLMIVASRSDHRLTRAEVDHALGIGAGLPPQEES